MLGAKKQTFSRPSGYQISRSVRLRSSASAYFNRTNSTSTNTNIWTWSGWVKRGTLGSRGVLIGGGTTNVNYICFNDSGTTDFFGLTYANTPASLTNVMTTQVFRDPSAWYHLVVAYDSTSVTSTITGSSTDRVRLYVNGVQVTAFSATTAPGLNATSTINSSSTLLNIGRRNLASPDSYFDGYLTEFNFIDGQALTPSSFGEYNAVTGVWQPKKYAGTYGTNGFYLNFSDNSGVTATTIGKDYSGNGNNWTPNNISITAGTTYDSMLDVPTPFADGGNGRGNYAVLNPLSRTACTITNGNLQAVGDGGNYDNLPASIAFDAGGSDGFYWEFTSISNDSTTLVGICSINNSELNKANPTFSFANSADGWGYIGGGNKTNSGTNTSYGNSWTNNDVIGVAVKNGKIWFSKNGTFQASGDPAAGTNQAFSSISGLVYPVAAINGTNGFIANFGQRPFTYTPPTGFKALNTQNLPTPTIINGAQYMAATLYTGTGSSLAITNTVNGVSFQPDWVWVKSRSAATDHALYDAVRGVQKQLESNTTTAETTETTGLTAFGSTGFTVGALAQMNTSAATYVAWQWNAGGSTVTNTSGSISAQVRANATAGFSVVTYTGTGANATVGHGLGVAPSMIIVKERSAAGDSWYVYHVSLGATNNIFLDSTAASSASATAWNSTAPTSTVFSLGTSLGVNQSTQTYVAYCFAAVAGYSAFGSYTGNGSADGPFVFCGFRPRWIMFKKSSATDDWVIYDTARDDYNVASKNLYANGAFAEDSNTANRSADILSNGFKLRSSGTFINGSGATFIFAAFAENPFKNSLAR